MLTILPLKNICYTSKINSTGSSFVKFKQPDADCFVSSKNVAFTGSKRLTENIEYEQYVNLTEKQKEELRCKYNNFYNLIDVNELYSSKYPKGGALPLSKERDMQDFLRVAESYNKYRSNKIICVGRSPKWFLNASIWMKNGIEDYSFAAFSSYWYSRNHLGLGPKLYKIEERLPTEKEVSAYRHYMKKINCDPVSIVRKAQKSGLPVIITDYIHSGGGLTSYLDLMSQFAEKAGVLDDFVQSIELFTMGSVEYLDTLGYVNYFALPTALMPEKLQNYKIKQVYHDMSADVLRSILDNKNTNECRSTYYPPAAWTVYNPIKYKTGFIPDEKLKDMSKMKLGASDNFTAAMKDYRNLMNFRILDYLYLTGRLKESHKTR